MFDDARSVFQHSTDTAPTDLAPATVPGRRRLYLSVRWKFCLALCTATCWALFSWWIARAWLAELSGWVGVVPAYLVVLGIAIIPGFMNAFLVTSLIFDRRPAILVPTASLPGISILVAAYNEEAFVASTIQSIAAQNYPGPLQVIVINDGSTDNTATALTALDHPWLQIITLFGIATRNGILLVSHYRQLLSEGVHFREAEALPGSAVEVRRDLAGIGRLVVGKWQGRDLRR